MYIPRQNHAISNITEVKIEERWDTLLKNKMAKSQ